MMINALGRKTGNTHLAFKLVNSKICLGYERSGGID